MQRRLQPRATEAAAYPAWQVTGCAGRFALDVLRALVCHQAHKLTTYSFEQAVEAVRGALQPYVARLQPCVSGLQLFASRLQPYVSKLQPYVSRCSVRRQRSCCRRCWLPRRSSVRPATRHSARGWCLPQP